MVKKLFRSAVPAAAILLLTAAAFAPGLFLGRCDFIGASVFPSYLMSADAIVDFRNHIPPGASYRHDDYSLWTKTVTTHSGKTYLVLCIDFRSDDFRPDTFLIYDSNLKFLQKVDRYDAYGAGAPAHQARRFAAPGPDPGLERILVAFEGSPDPFVVVNPGGGPLETRPDSSGILGQYGDTLLNDSFAIPGVSGTWFFRSDYYSNTYYRDSLTAAYASGGSGTGSIFTTGLLNTAGIFYGAALLADSSVAVFFRGNGTGGGYVASSPDPGTLPLPFASDDTPIGNVPDEYNKLIFFTRDGLVVAGWGDDWKIYKPNGKVVTGPSDQDREDWAWTFSPDGGAYYIADGRESRLVKARPWW